MSYKTLAKWPECEHEVACTLDEPGHALPLEDEAHIYLACKDCHDKYVVLWKRNLA